MSSAMQGVVRQERRRTGGREILVDLMRSRERIPALWLVPASVPAPMVVLLHGLSSEKERMAGSVGKALLAHGVGSLALDLPLHGERSEPRTAGFGNPLALAGAWRAAVREVHDTIRWLGEQKETDAERLGMIGYSLGGFLTVMTASDAPEIRVVALAAAGDLPDTMPYASMVRAVVDPLRAVRRLAGRPLLLVNGRRDTSTRPAQAERLFEAASDPKTMHWYPGGHWPPPASIEATAQWMAVQLANIDEATGRKTAGRPRRAG